MSALGVSYMPNLRPKKPSSWRPHTLVFKRVWLDGSEWIEIGKLGREACFDLSLTRYGRSLHRLVPTVPPTKGAHAASVVTLQFQTPCK